MKQRWKSNNEREQNLGQKCRELKSPYHIFLCIMLSNDFVSSCNWSMEGSKIRADRCWTNFKRGILGFFMYCIQHCVGGCWDQTQDSCEYGIGCQTLNHLAKSHPHSAKSHPHSAKSHPLSTKSNPHSSKYHPHSAKSHPHSVKSHPNSAKSHPHSAKSHPQSAKSHPHTAKSHPHSAKPKSHPHSAKSHTLG